MTDRRNFFTIATFGAVSLALPAARASAADSCENAGEATNLAILDRYDAAFNAHDVGAFKDVIGASYIQHNGRFGNGLAELQKNFHGYFHSIPDIHMQIEDRIAASDKVVARTLLTATHDRTITLGPEQSFPATGKKLAWGGMEIWRVVDGRFAEHWDQNDLASLVRQLRGI
jgi:predicted ester cyclase